MTQPKEPWVKLYSERILADLEFNSCSLAARGLWVTIFTLMHRSDHKGFLIGKNGKPLDMNQLARAARCSSEEAERCLSELVTSGVFSVSEDGVVFSRGMVREAHLSAERSKAGKKGGEAKSKLSKEEIDGNGILPKQNGWQNPGKQGGKPPGKPLNSNSGVLGECLDFSEEKKNKAHTPPLGEGVQGEGVLPKQNGWQNPGKPPSPADLAQKAAFLRGWGTHPGEVQKWLATMQTLIRAGISAEQLDAELDRKDRIVTEPSWDFTKRLLPDPNRRLTPQEIGRRSAEMTCPKPNGKHGLGNMPPSSP